VGSSFSRGRPLAGTTLHGASQRNDLIAAAENAWGEGREEETRGKGRRVFTSSLFREADKRSDRIVPPMSQSDFALVESPDSFDCFDSFALTGNRVLLRLASRCNANDPNPAGEHRLLENFIKRATSGV